MGGLNDQGGLVGKIAPQPLDAREFGAPRGVVELGKLAVSELVGENLATHAFRAHLRNSQEIVWTFRRFPGARNGATDLTDSRTAAPPMHDRSTCTEPEGAGAGGDRAA